MEIRAAINWLLSMTKNIKDENGHPRMHHEINLSDTKMVATQKLKTVVGHPIKVFLRRNRHGINKKHGLEHVG